MLVSSQHQQPHVPRLPRTQSSVLAFALREFLNTPTGVGSATYSEAEASADSYVRSPQPPLVRTPAAPPQPQHVDVGCPPTGSLQPDNAVWVDCFFYGFWLEKSKAAAYQQSIKSGHS